MVLEMVVMLAVKDESRHRHLPRVQGSYPMQNQGGENQTWLRANARCVQVRRESWCLSKFRVDS